jgi:PAS domain S-box-containing protein
MTDSGVVEDAPPEHRRAASNGEAAPAEAVRRARRDPLAWAMAILGIYILLSSAWWLSGLADPGLSSRLTAAAAMPGGIIMCLIALRLRGTNQVSHRTRHAWSVIAVGLIAFGVGALVNLSTSLVPGLGPIGVVGSALELSTYVLCGAALALLPKPVRTSFDITLFGLDVAIFAWSAAMLVWHFLILPDALATGRDLLAALGATVFPIADLTLMFVLVAIVLRGLEESTRAALAIAAGSMALVFVGDLIAGDEKLKGVYTLGGAAWAAYSVAWLGLALSAYAQWRIQDSDRPKRLADYSRSIPWLPYVAVILAFTLPAIRGWNDTGLLQQHIPAAGLLMALVVARLAVTSRQNASLATAEREKLAAAVDQAAEAILTTDRAGHVTYVNAAFAQITGLPISQVVGRDPDLLRGLADSGPMADMSAALARGSSWAGRVLLKRADGMPVEIDMAVSPMRDSTGKIAGSVAVARDISHERALEIQLSQAQRMEAVGRLAGGIAHDFNNILTAISGFAELAVSELPGDHPVSSDLEQILKASDRAAALTRALLAFSRRQVMQAKLVDINDVLGGLTPMLGRLIGENIQLVVRLDPGLGMTMADRAQLEQVVVNLAVNARDAMPDGGTLVITTANTELDVSAAGAHIRSMPGSYVTLVVADTGVGMTPEVIEHAFEPFYTTKERTKGTGLGLSTVIGIVEQSGGFVEVKSEASAGSTFTVHLPQVAGAAQANDLLEFTGLTQGGTETILVTEDEDAVRLFVERVLTTAGYRVLTAAHGAAALATARSLVHLDLLFTDVVMPGMSGVELAAELTRSRSGLPVIFASGYSEEDGLREALGNDSVPYLAKPFTAETLLAKVREVLDRRRQRVDSPEEPAADAVEVAAGSAG